MRGWAGGVSPRRGIRWRFEIEGSVHRGRRAQACGGKVGKASAGVSTIHGWKEGRKCACSTVCRRVQAIQFVGLRVGKMQVRSVPRVVFY